MAFQWTHPEFQFRSARDWGQVSTDDPTVLQLFCPETHTVATLTMDDRGVAAERFESAARQLVASRKAAYLDGMRRQLGPGTAIDVQYSHETAGPHPSGAFEVSYEAVHTGRSFLGYLGFVSTRKVVNLFVDTQVAFLPGRRGMFREVVAGLTFTLP